MLVMSSGPDFSEKQNGTRDYRSIAGLLNYQNSAFLATQGCCKASLSISASLVVGCIHFSFKTYLELLFSSAKMPAQVPTSIDKLCPIRCVRYAHRYSPQPTPLEAGCLGTCLLLPSINNYHGSIYGISKYELIMHY